MFLNFAGAVVSESLLFSTGGEIRGNGFYYSLVAEGQFGSDLHSRDCFCSRNWMFNITKTIEYERDSFGTAE